MNKTVVILGAGQIGSRHLQGLARMRTPADVVVVDPSEDSLAIARARLDETDRGLLGELRWAADTSTLPDAIDLAIVASSAQVRAQLARELLARGRVGAVIFEKVLFQEEREYDEIAALLVRAQVRAWVNCPRRLLPEYHALRATLATQPIFMSATGGDWGLGCNAIHAIDLFMFLGASGALEVDASGLDAETVPARRPGFIELTGSLRARTADGSELVMHSQRGSQALYLVNVLSAEAHATACEQLGWLRTYARTSAWAEQRVPLELPYQSKLTGPAADAILAGGEPGLTPFDESARMHVPMLRALLQHLHRHAGWTGDRCPIT